MRLLLIGVITLHLVALILLLVATFVSAWTVGETSSSDLWTDCSTVNGGDRCHPTTRGVWIQAVQGLMVLSVIYSGLSFIIFFCQLFTLQKGGHFFLTGTFQTLASLLVMSAALVYTVVILDLLLAGETFGFSYFLAWAAFPLALASGLIYMFLRKRE